MKKFYPVLAILALCLGGAYSSANADVLYTPSLSTGVGDLFVCSLVNTSSAAISVTFKIYDYTGSAVKTLSASVPARHEQSASLTNNTYGDRYYCKFTVPDKTVVRAVGYAAYIVNSVDLRLEAAVPAN